MYNYNSYKWTTELTKVPAAQISKSSDAAWSAVAKDGQTKSDVANNTSGLNGTDTRINQGRFCALFNTLLLFFLRIYKLMF